MSTLKKIQEIFGEITDLIKKINRGKPCTWYTATIKTNNIIEKINALSEINQSEKNNTQNNKQFEKLHPLLNKLVELFKTKYGKVIQIANQDQLKNLSIIPLLTIPNTPPGEKLRQHRFTPRESPTLIQQSLAEAGATGTSARSSEEEPDSAESENTIRSESRSESSEQENPRRSESEEEEFLDFELDEEQEEIDTTQNATKAIAAKGQARKTPQKKTGAIPKSITKSASSKNQNMEPSSPYEEQPGTPSTLDPKQRFGSAMHHLQKNLVMKAPQGNSIPPLQMNQENQGGAKSKTFSNIPPPPKPRFSMHQELTMQKERDAEQPMQYNTLDTAMGGASKETRTSHSTNMPQSATPRWYEQVRHQGFLLRKEVPALEVQLQDQGFVNKNAQLNSDSPQNLITGTPNDQSGVNGETDLERKMRSMLDKMCNLEYELSKHKNQTEQLKSQNEQQRETIVALQNQLRVKQPSEPRDPPNGQGELSGQREKHQATLNSLIPQRIAGQTPTFTQSSIIGIVGNETNTIPSIGSTISSGNARERHGPNVYNQGPQQFPQYDAYRPRFNMNDAIKSVKEFNGEGDRVEEDLVTFTESSEFYAMELTPEDEAKYVTCLTKRMITGKAKSLLGTKCGIKTVSELNALLRDLCVERETLSSVLTKITTSTRSDRPMKHYLEELVVLKRKAIEIELRDGNADEKALDKQYSTLILTQLKNNTGEDYKGLNIIQPKTWDEAVEWIRNVVIQPTEHTLWNESGYRADKTERRAFSASRTDADWGKLQDRLEKMQKEIQELRKSTQKSVTIKRQTPYNSRSPSRERQQGGSDRNTRWDSHNDQSQSQNMQGNPRNGNIQRENSRTRQFNNSWGNQRGHDQNRNSSWNGNNRRDDSRNRNGHDQNGNNSWNGSNKRDNSRNRNGQFTMEEEKNWEDPFQVLTGEKSNQ